MGRSRPAGWLPFAAHLGRAGRDLAAWWWQQIAHLVGRPGPAGGAPVLHYEGSTSAGPQFAVHRRTPRWRASRPGGAPTGGRAGLQVPAGMVLERWLTLPAAAERGLATMLATEMDRLTPFAVAAVFWSGHVVERHRPSGTIRVRLSVVPIASVLPILRSAEARGWQPTWLAIADADGTLRRLPMGAVQQARPRSKAGLVAAVAAGLVAAATVFPLLRQARSIGAAEAALAALRPQVAQVEDLRRRLADAAATTTLVDAEAARIGDALAILAATTATLPDDTFLTEFTLRTHRLAITGQSADAVSLITRLFAQPGVTDVHFTAPTVRLPALRGERFTLAATWAIAPAEPGRAEALLARPPFARDRRPDHAAPGAAAAAGGPGMPRLTGIVLSGGDRRAIFTPAGEARSVVVREGGAVGPFQVGTIAAGTVVLTGPGGTHVLAPVSNDPPAKRGLTAADLPELPTLIPNEARPPARFAEPAGPYGMAIYRYSPAARGSR